MYYVEKYMLLYFMFGIQEPLGIFYRVRAQCLPLFLLSSSEEAEVVNHGVHRIRRCPSLLSALRRSYNVSLVFLIYVMICIIVALIICLFQEVHYVLIQ